MHRENSSHKVLVIGMADSIHLARWLLQYQSSPYEFRLISSSPHRRLHPDIRKMVKGSHQSGINVSMPVISRYLSLPMWILDRIFNDVFRSSLIKRQIMKFRPDLVHALELQNAGYACAEAYSRLAPATRPKLLITNYGSEIVWFRQFPRHLLKLKRLVSLADAFSAECERDVKLAREIGFNGLVLPTIPVSGGVDMELENVALQETDLNGRKTIAIKGYQNIWGQALIALDAIDSIADELNDFRIELFSCNRKTLKAAKQLRQRTGLRVVAHKKHSLHHADVLAIFRRSAVYIGLSKSDGISTSMIEAMSQGAIPIQSNSSCGAEWLENERDGFLVRYDDRDAVARAITKVISSLEFRQSAQARNYATIASRYNKLILSQVARGYYSRLLA